MKWFSEDELAGSISQVEKSIPTQKSSKVSTEYSNIRKRLLEQQSRRADQEIVRLRTLQAGPDRLLIENKIENIRAAKAQLRNEVTFVEQQDAAARKEATSFNRMTPLQQVAKIKKDLHRSDRDRETAIAGILERERSQRKKLTRGAFDRVQARAAARRRSEFARDFERTGKYKRGIERRAPTARDVPRVRRELEICKERHERREVLAAKAMLGHSRIGYRKRQERREILKFIMC